MGHLLSDPIFFYALAYVAFVVLALIFGRKPGLAWIDGEIAKISEQLRDAKRLRSEAEELLAQSKQRKTAALAEAAAIVNHAKDEAQRLEVEADANLKYVLARHEQHATDRIRMLEQDAISNVRSTVVVRAMKTVRQALATQLDDAAASRLVNQAIDDMPRLVAEKAKAA